MNVFSKLPGKFKSIQLDITNTEDVDRVVSGVDVDVIFYGAAITAGVEREISDPLSVLDVNVIGLLNVFKAACRAPSVNRIINISSRAAYKGDTAEYLAYASSKAGLVALTRSIAKSFGKKGVKAFNIAPGFVQSDMAKSFIAKYGEEHA